MENNTKINSTETIRLRVCAMCIEKNSVLLVEHKRWMDNKYFPETAWILPGGGLNIGETLVECAKRELTEETGYIGEIGKALFLKELVYPFPSDTQRTPVVSHNLSIVFLCKIIGGELRTGIDPERSLNDQLILRTRWISLNELEKHVLYPPSLTNFILDGVKTNFEKINIPIFNSVE